MQAVYLFQVLMTKNFIFIPLSYNFENKVKIDQINQKLFCFLKCSLCLLALLQE